MKKLKWSLFILIIPCFVHAGILIGPYMGYDIGLSAKTSLLAATGDTYGFTAEPGSGFAYGGRVGYSLAVIFAAVDYSMSSFKIEDKFTTLGSTVFPTPAINKSGVDQTALGLTVGANLALLRVWGKYLFNVKWEIEKDNFVGTTAPSPYDTELKGNGIAFGLGFKLLPMLNLFAEYQQVTVDEVEKFTSSAGNDARSQISTYERKRSSILIGINTPFDF